MKAQELIEQIETMGGSLELAGDRLRCKLPEEVADELIDELRLQRQAVLSFLRQRRGFHCVRCGTHFDTSVGKAAHLGYGCGNPRPVAEPVKNLPSCAKCGGSALYREKDGTVTCESCAEKNLQHDQR